MGYHRGYTGNNIGHANAVTHAKYRRLYQKRKTDKIIPNHHSTYELHKPIFRKAESCEVYSSFRDSI